MDGLEAVAVEKAQEALPGEVVQVGGRVDEAPALPAEARVEAADVARCHGEERARVGEAGELLDEKVRAGQVLDGVPEAGDVEPPVAEIVGEEVALHHVEPERLPRVADPVLGDVDAGRRLEAPAGEVQEEAVGAAHLEEPPVPGGVEEALERREAQAEVLLDDRAVRHVVEVLVAEEVVAAVERGELVGPELEVGPGVAAGGAAQEPGVEGAGVRAPADDARAQDGVPGGGGKLTRSSTM